jgi:hypothetical protein
MSSMMMLFSNPSSSRIIAAFHGFGELGNAGMELVDESWLVGELRRWVRANTDGVQIYWLPSRSCHGALVCVQN